MKKLLITFSGGETSAYMTNSLLIDKKILRAYEDILVVFVNTSQENDETLDFVKKCDTYFGFNTIWLEGVVHFNERKSNSHKIVDFTSACRDGQIYEDTIKKYGIPNIKFMTCTRDLKLAPIRSFLRSINWKNGEYHTAIGIRADEENRRAKNAKTEGIIYPLLDTHPTTKPDINKFWSEQDFRLCLYGYQGNCKWCWKKSTRKLLAIMDDDPSIFDFPERMEKLYNRIGPEFEKKIKPPPEYQRTFFRNNTSTSDLRALYADGSQRFDRADDDSLVLPDGRKIKLDVENDDGTGCSESCEVDFSDTSGEEKLMLFLDLETLSDIDLIFHGLRRYAEDASTQVICMAYAFDDGEIVFWWSHEPFPPLVIAHIGAGKPITAHQAHFERHIFDHVLSRTHGVEPPANEQWRCSMATGLANGFAGGLDALAVGLGLPYRKHTEGARLIREYCAPGHLMEFKPGDAETMKAYNVGDVETMRAAVKCLRPLTEEEWEEYHINCLVNERGLPIDVKFCEAALGYTREVADDANIQISRLTGGVMVKATQRKARDAWLFPKLTPMQMKLLEVYKGGVKKTSLDQDHRRYLLECEDLNDEARKLLEYIDNAGSSALKKFAVAAHQHVAGRVHNTFLWNGAGRTGRFSGKGLQPHNIRRDVFDHDQAEALIADILGDYEIDAPADTMARLLRAMIAHPDGLYWVDWSSIEGRVAPWLARSAAGEKKLDLFRADRDVYTVTAAGMFGVPEESVDADFRQSGKIAELSLQFGGGHNALIGMAKNYGTTFEEDAARDIVALWRRSNIWAPRTWDAYDKAITNAVLTPGTDFEVGRVIYHSDGVNFLWCQLPSERLLAYPKPRFEPYMTPWGEERIGATFQSHFKPAAGEPPIRLHARGALLFQNTVQAVAADCLREALLRAHDEGLEIVGHVHDEIIGLGSEDDGQRLNNIMLERPWWSDGLPLATGGVSWGRRYGK